MGKSAFNQWKEDITAQYQKLQRYPTDISETVILSGKVYTISLGKGELAILWDDCKYPLSELRGDYYKHKEPLAAVLESITARVTEFVVDSEFLMDAVVQDMMPDVVMKRLKGERAEGDSGELMKAKAFTLMTELTQEIETGVRDTFGQLEITLAEIDSYNLEIEKAARGFTLHYGELLATNTMTLHSGDSVETAFSFVKNHERIQTIIREFLKAAKTIQSIQKANK